MVVIAAATAVTKAMVMEMAMVVGTTMEVMAMLNEM